MNLKLGVGPGHHPDQFMKVPEDLLKDGVNYNPQQKTDYMFNDGGDYLMR